MVGNLFQLDGKVALVTGASRGIGRSIAEAMAAAGARVVLNSRDPAALARVATGIEAAGGKADILPFDLGDAAAVQRGVVAAAALHGRLDVLVNNAGTTARHALADWTLEEWRQIVEVNLTGCFAAAQSAAGVMTAGGRVINIASVLSVIGRPNVPAYVATKSGLAGLTRALAVELAPRGITVNAIAPGYIRTEFTETLQGDAEFNQMVARRVPMGRWGLPDEIAGGAVFLASGAAAYLTGHLLAIDGGLLAAL